MTTPFKRAYKACEACRKNKAKCEIESAATSCSRCQREQKECVFPAQRSTKRAKIKDSKAKDTGTLTINSGIPKTQQAGLVQTIGAEKAGFTTQTHATNPGTRPPSGPRLSPASQPLIDQYAETQIVADARRPGTQWHHTFSSVGQRPAQRQLQQQYPSSEADRDSRQSASLQSDVLQTFVTSSSDAVGLLFKAAEEHNSDSSDEHAASENLRQMAMPCSVHSMPSPGLASNETLSLWEQHRFVRQGWFTSREAVSYIEFFFRNLSPLSPVADSYYADQQNHKKLILEEPLLCCTLLMIASRHHVPAKGSGSRARADVVHNRVWRHIEHLIQRITFGSEKYSLAKTRTIGSIQAILLIIEWHPRALHFPPENDGWDASLAPSIDDTYQQQNINSEASKRWREDVFEPAKRSERMSWMLVGLAMALAHELGVFNHEDTEGTDPGWIAKHQAILRTRRLLFLYASQLSVQLGCSNVFPQGSHQSLIHAPTSRGLAEEQVAQDREMLITRWIEITKLSVTATEMLFANRAVTRQMFKGSRYVSLLEHFEPLLCRWHTDFAQMSCPTISEGARQILLVEYHFVRMYINSIAVQALVERASSYNISNGWLDQDFLRSEFSQDSRFVKEVRDASLAILRIATELSEKTVLQYCPVRVFLRVVAASIYLLKTISLGSREAEMTRSLTQLQRCIEALQNNQPDDIHLSSRYATLIAKHVRRFKRNFRVQKPSMHPAANSRAASRGPETSNILGRPSTEANDAQVGPSQQIHKQVNALPSQENQVVDNSATGWTDVTIPFDFDENGMVENWLAQPFNSQFAPFGTEGIQAGSGLAIDSLDFLWNMAT